MPWTLDEAVKFYKSQGAPQNQSALVGLLKEIQQENGGGIPGTLPPVIAGALGVKESYVLAVIKRIPSLRISDQHLLEICSGAVCGRSRELAALAERLAGKNVTVKFVPCMRLCGKGPNLRWDGTLYNRADEALLCRLLEK